MNLNPDPMDADTGRSVADAMECAPALLPYLPELLADIDDLSGSPTPALALLHSVLAPDMRTATDLGCGKGGLAVALAKDYGMTVRGIDAFEPFLVTARERAEREGVTHRCTFSLGDLRRLADDDLSPVDLLIFSSVGPVFGDHRETMRRLRQWIRPGGYLLIEDAFLADDAARDRVIYSGYLTHEETIREWTAWGDTLVAEEWADPQVLRALNERNTALIRKRADHLARHHPEMAALFAEYVERQEHETDVLGVEVPCATWLFQIRH